MPEFRIALAQINPTVGDVQGNTDLVIERIKEAEFLSCDLVAMPELVITGYPPEDLVLRRRFVEDNIEAIKRVCQSTSGFHVTAIVGFVDLQEFTYNAAAVIYNGSIAGIYHKKLLPNYGVFDEERYFAAGTFDPVFDIAGAKVGVNICEDIWHPSGPIQTQAAAGAQIIVNINGSPFHMGKRELREKMLAARAAENSVTVCYCNMVGGQDSLIFDGGSMIHGPDGKCIVSAPLFCEKMLVADLDGETIGLAGQDSDRYNESNIDLDSLISVSAIETKERNTLPEPVLGISEITTASTEEMVYNALVLGTRDYVRKTGFNEAVIALSGGIDSTLTAAIAVDALGANNVTGVSMPSRYSSEGSISDAMKLAENLDIKLISVPIEEPLNAFLKVLGKAIETVDLNPTVENLQARIRGTIMMALSNQKNWLVLTTGNKSESATGYTTLYGDMTGGLAVIQDVPKMLVYQLARYVNERNRSELIPVSIITKPPSAELRPNQFDEDSLMAYEKLDPILQLFVEEDRTLEEIAAEGFPESDIRNVMTLVTNAEYKRRQAAPGLKITPRAFGRERRFPIVNQYKGY